ncbi:phosphatase PAP2 family protein [Streptococcus hongkongensis]|nr:phosphatase [Streptococcus uberis]
MKNKQQYWVIASFAFLIFVMIGYMVRFFPENLVPFDQTIQTAVRGNLPEELTDFFKIITKFGNVMTQIIIVVISVSILAFKRWKAEAYFMLTIGIIAAILITGLKLIYQRGRPSLIHIVVADGFSFPSGHSMGSMLIIGALIIIAYQRISNKVLKTITVSLMGLLIAAIGISRIYLGVHYPSDVLAGFILGFGILEFLYPLYVKKRFEWRFQSKQK